MAIKKQHWHGPQTTIRASILVRGIVQGVGFRPFVHRIAHAYHLAGWVLNSTEGVEIEAEGTAENVSSFLTDLSSKAPPAASIHRVDVHYLPPIGYTSFAIEPSHDASSNFPLVSPDIATCPDCLAELFDSGDKRYRYPFINCTNCGPRFTIVEGVPYDRPKTSMKSFTMCPACLREYGDPGDRRFHAQPNACPDCGPSVWLQKSGEDALQLPVGEAVELARRLLKSGKILAVKGLGGFHLACDASNAEAVRELRRRKRRVEKPFAIMVRDLETACRLCLVNEAEGQLLTSVRRPIALLERREKGPVVDEVAPGNKRLGVMLPYTPIHHLLLEPTEEIHFDALVMTSGNLSEEPLAKDNGEACSRLSSLADYFLLHDRPIHVRCDDSVTQLIHGKEAIIRRSRGYTPLPIRLNFELAPILACGAQLKNTFCITQDNYAFLSQHIGDLENQETLDFFTEAVEHFRTLFNLAPSAIAHDLHPDYLSTRYAQSHAKGQPGTKPIPTIAVQHHHAHIASCMVENGLKGKVIGVAFDGTGYGSDGNIWGGEFLITDLVDFERAAHLKYIPLPGGESSIKKPYRMAFSYLLQAYGDDLPELDFLKGIDRTELEAIKVQVARGINSPLTSSCGRLFDAVSALLGIRGEISYEGQAAIELEMATRDDVPGAYPFAFSRETPLEIDTSPVIRAIVNDLLRGEEKEVMAARFHNCIAEMIAGTCKVIRQRSDLTKVCLSGGVFQNRFLLARTLAALNNEGFETYIHHLVPPNDGGISLGQAIIASERIRADHA